MNAATSTHATIMHFAIWLPDWDSLDSVRRVHSDLEIAALVFFALLVVCEALAHLSDDKKKERRFDKIGIAFFALAVLAEIVAYPYGQRNDELSTATISSLSELVLPRERFLLKNAAPFINAVRPFAGQKIEIRTNPSGIPDPNDIEETGRFVSTLGLLLGQVSGWSISQVRVDTGWGVRVAVSRKSSLATRNAANALASSLGDCGLTDMQGRKPTVVVFGAGAVEGTPETVVLFVGRQPR
jgi:hypothetical protein